MENLFLEILRILDLKFNNSKEDLTDKYKNSDFYFFPLEYNKLLMSNDKIDINNLNYIIEDNHYYFKSSLFSVSKLDAESTYVKSINFDKPDTNFYKSRDIIFYICIFLKYNNYLGQLNKDFLYETEHSFINKNISNNNIDLYINTINAFYGKKNSLDLYNKLTNIFEKKGFDIKEKLFTDSTTDSLRLAINLYFYSNSFDIGLKESLTYNFETVVFYIILYLLSTDINKIKLSTIYFNIENSY